MNHACMATSLTKQSSGGGLLLLRRKAPLKRRSVAYFCSGAHIPLSPVAERSQPVDATPSDMNHFSKGGVYETRKTGHAFRGAEDRHVAPLEGGRVVA